MRPARKSRSVNKWNDYVSEVSPVKDVDSPKGNDRRVSSAYTFLFAEDVNFPCTLRATS